ncbi:MAG: sensor domain-containing diguanylate cyclase [Candidatus Omnitrophica bacterium]|nr:sensor domain-containing diguanylate cyclase [Candidatus Omnitrophota bacterium]
MVISILISKISTDRKERTCHLSCDSIVEEINTLQDSISNRKKLVTSFTTRLKRYSQLKDYTNRLTTVVSLDETANIVLEETMRIIPEFSSCILYLVNPETYELNCFLSKSKEHLAIKSKKGDIFDHWVLKKMQPLIVEDVNKDFRFDVEKIDKEELRNVHSLVAAPLITYNKLIGVLRVDSRNITEFNQEDLRLLSTLSDLAAAAIDNAFLYKRTLDFAIRDGLTSLYLKGYFMERLEEELHRASSKKIPLSLLMLDIDRFKDFNDKFGHIAGDIILKIVSKMLVDIAGSVGNIVCRFGGEEFVMLLVGAEKKEAIRVAEDLRRKIKSKRITLRRQKIGISVSLGVVSCPKDGYELQDLMRKVDALLYEAKKTGRDKVCFLEK